MNKEEREWLERLIRENKESDSELTYTYCPFSVLYALQQENEKLKEKNTIYKYTIKGQHKKIEELKNAKRISKKVHKERKRKLQEENEKLNHYKLLYQKVKERNDKAIVYLEQALEYSKKDCIPSRQFTCQKALKILKGNEE